MSSGNPIPPSCSDPEVFEPLVDDYALGILAPEDEERVLRRVLTKYQVESARKGAEYQLARLQEAVLGGALP